MQSTREILKDILFAWKCRDKLMLQRKIKRGLSVKLTDMKDDKILNELLNSRFVNGDFKKMCEKYYDKYQAISNVNKTSIGNCEVCNKEKVEIANGKCLDCRVISARKGVPCTECGKIARNAGFGLCGSCKYKLHDKFKRGAG